MTPERFRQLHALAAPLEQLLLAGGGSRLEVDPATGLNAYGCAPRPRPDVLAFGSSTASSISPQAYARSRGAPPGADRRRPRRRARSCSRARDRDDQARHPRSVRGRRTRRSRGRTDAIRHRWRVCRAAPGPNRAGSADRQPRDGARRDRERSAGSSTRAAFRPPDAIGRGGLPGYAARRMRSRPDPRRHRADPRLRWPAAPAGRDRRRGGGAGRAGVRRGPALPGPCARRLQDGALCAELRCRAAAARALRRADRRRGRRLPDAAVAGAPARLPRGRLDGPADRLEILRRAAVRRRAAGPGRDRGAHARAGAAARGPGRLLQPAGMAARLAAPRRRLCRRRRISGSCCAGTRRSARCGRSRPCPERSACRS